MAPDKEERSKYGAEGHCKGNSAVWAQVGDVWTQAQAKSLTHVAVSWGTPKKSPMKKAAETPSMCEKGAFSMRVMLEDPKENKLSWMLTLSIGGSTQVSGDAQFTQWTNSIAISFPLLQTAGTAPKPASHPLSYSSKRQFRGWVTVTMFHFFKFIFLQPHVYLTWARPGEPVKGRNTS